MKESNECIINVEIKKQWMINELNEKTKGLLILFKEWDFIKSTCPHVPGGEARAGNTFCQVYFIHHFSPFINRTRRTLPFSGFNWLGSLRSSDYSCGWPSVFILYGCPCLSSLFMRLPVLIFILRGPLCPWVFILCGCPCPVCFYF